MKIRRTILLLLFCMVLLCGVTACNSQNYLMFEDDEWSGHEIGNDRVLTNGELEMDDWDR